MLRFDDWMDLKVIINAYIPVYKEIIQSESSSSSSSSEYHTDTHYIYIYIYIMRINVHLDFVKFLRLLKSRLYS